MMSTFSSEEDIRAIRSHGANHIRWQLTWGGFPHGEEERATTAEYDAWLASAVVHLEETLPLLNSLGIRIVVDLHTPPRGRDEGLFCRVFREPAAANRFVEIWRDLATRLKGEPAVVAFDLLNEPTEGEVPQGLEGWRALALRAAKAIREIDPSRTIVFEPAEWGGASAFENLEPLPLENVVYSFHFYQPMAFTHQGVFDERRGFAYPGEFEGQNWDRAAMERAVRPVVEFQKRTKCQIYVGEFGAARWAPGASKWLTDAIGIWEKNRWPWAFHAFREWDGWSPEHGEDPENHSRTTSTTSRMKVLERAWRKNAFRKPSDGS